jgi:hypothetical protein
VLDFIIVFCHFLNSAMSQATPKPVREKGERRYTSLACQNCRRRKVKCNNEQPQCSNCRLYENECVYGLDRRRASSTLIKTQAPQINTMSHTATSNGSDPAPSHTGGPSITEVERDGHRTSSLHPQHSTPEFQHQAADWAYWDDIAQSTDFMASTTFETDHIFNDSMDQLDFVHNQFPETLQTPSVSQGTSPDYSLPTEIPSLATVGASVPDNVSKTRSFPDDQTIDPLDDVTKQLTSRLGRLQIAEDGRPRYYGATSNLHLLHSGPGSLTQPNIRHVLIHGEAAILSAGLHWSGDDAYETRLVNLFFSWHNNLQFPVDKDLFLRDRTRYRQGQLTDLFTPSLENAILCVGCAYTDRTHPSISESADEFFALRAKAYLDIEIDSPTIATAQALLILSSHEAAQTRESRGWIYMGMAIQVVIDLGLHLDLELPSSENDTKEDLLIIRRNVFWTVKSIDTLWSAYSGRPSMMKNLVHNQRGPLPSRTYEWTPYMDEHNKLNFPPDFDFRVAAFVHIHLATLMLILGRVSEVLYSGVPDMSSNVQAFVAAADIEFRDWLHNLPANVQVDMAKSFHVQGVLELHLIYHESMILLHRPLITATDSAASPPGGIVAGEETAAISSNRCVESADAICDILRLYRDRYGLRRLHHQMVHVAMTAAMIHVYQLCVTSSGTPENQKAQTSFLTCIQALGEMGQTFKSASRALDVVTSLRQSWRDDTSAGDRFKRARLR